MRDAVSYSGEPTSGTPAAAVATVPAPRRANLRAGNAACGTACLGQNAAPGPAPGKRKMLYFCRRRANQAKPVAGRRTAERCWSGRTGLPADYLPHVKPTT
jgi:hypothetical protein